MSEPVPLGIVIPTLGRHALLARVLERLERQSAGPHSFEVVVAPDAAEERVDVVRELVASRPFAARVVEPGRSGASAARNAGWRALATRLVLFLDDDVLPDARLVEEHLGWHRRHPELETGVLGDVRWASELRVTGFMRWLEHGIQFDYKRIRGDEAGWGRFYTANGSVKRELLERVGGFDEEGLPFGYEDLDFAVRAHDDGFRLLYAPRASAEHVHPMDLDYWCRRMARIAVSERAFVALHPGARPYFRDLLEDARARGPVRGRAARVAGLVPRGTPLIGPWVWERADVYFRQQLAPHFFAAWERAGQEGPAVSASGARPSGPK